MKVQVYDKAESKWSKSVYEYVTTIATKDKKGNNIYKNILLNRYGHFIAKDMVLCRKFKGGEDNIYILSDD